MGRPVEGTLIPTTPRPRPQTGRACLAPRAGRASTTPAGGRAGSSRPATSPAMEDAAAQPTRSHRHPELLLSSSKLPLRTAPLTPSFSRTASSPSSALLNCNSPGSSQINSSGWWDNWLSYFWSGQSTLGGWRWHSPPGQVYYYLILQR